MDADLSDCVALSALYAMIKVSLGRKSQSIGEDGRKMVKQCETHLGRHGDPSRKIPKIVFQLEPWEAEREQKGFSVKEPSGAVQNGWSMG